MFKPKCCKLPCKNIEVRSVKNREGCKAWLGITPYFRLNRNMADEAFSPKRAGNQSGRERSGRNVAKKTTTLMIMKIRVR